MIDAVSRLLGPLLDLNLVTLDSLLAVLRNGLGCKLRWVVASTWTGGRVVKLLQAYGITTYAPGSPLRDPDHRSIRVPKQQARWAEYVLLRAGCPLVERPRDPGNKNITERPNDPYAPSWGAPARGVGLFGVGSALLLPFVAGVDVPVQDKSKRRARRRAGRRRR